MNVIFLSACKTFDPNAIDFFCSGSYACIRLRKLPAESNGFFFFHISFLCRKNVSREESIHRALGNEWNILYLALTDSHTDSQTIGHVAEWP